MMDITDHAAATRPEGVTVERLLDGPLPLLLTWADAHLRPAVWMTRHSKWLDDLLLRAGAVLIRGFQIAAPEDLEEIAVAVDPDLIDYVEGSSPRIPLTSKVYTSSEYPAEYEITLHNELSYAHRWPRLLYFACLRTAERGGETPLVDSRRVLTSLSDRIRDRFITRGVRYVRNMHGSRGMGLAWQTVFETSDRAVVVRYCNAGGIDFEWMPNGGLRTRQVRPAVVRHPVTGEACWFNQADQWHMSSLPAPLQEVMLRSVGEEGLPMNAYYGDGSQIEPDSLEEIRRVLRAEAVSPQWRDGDLLLVENTLVAHGRRPFVGERRVALAMTGSVGLEEARW